MQEFSLSNVCTTFGRLVRWWFPRNRIECCVWVVSFLFYFAFSQILSQWTSLIEAVLPGYWGYMGYDNSWYFHIYFGIENFDGYFLSRHPFIKLFFLPMMGIGYCLQTNFGVAAKLFFYLIVFNFISSVSVMLVFRYLTSIVCIGLTRSLLLTSMFAFFFTNILLSFTPESFPVSQMLMLTAIGMISADLGKKVPFVQLLVLTVVNFGVTTTNIIKVFIPYMFYVHIRKHGKKEQECRPCFGNRFDLVPCLFCDIRFHFSSSRGRSNHHEYDL